MGADRTEIKFKPGDAVQGIQKKSSRARILGCHDGMYNLIWLDSSPPRLDQVPFEVLDEFYEIVSDD